MSRAKLWVLWLILALVPAVALAQRGDVDRSRSRTESRRIETDRSAKRAKAINRNDRVKNDRSRVGGERATRSKSNRVESRGRSKVRESRRSQQTRQNRDPKAHREQSRTRTYRPRYDRGSEARQTADNRVLQERAKRSEARRKPEIRKEGERDRIKRSEIKRHPVKRGEFRHKHSKREEVRHRPFKHKRRAVAKRRHHISHHGKFHFRHPLKRYVYKHRRYHRHRSRGISIGFYIRIPTVRWHVGHTRRFAYRQIVTGHVAGDLEVVSTVRRRIRSVRRDYVEVEFEIDRIEILSRGQFLGEVDRFPGSLRRMRAKIYRDGFVQFDRMLYVIGNDYEGFELLSTRYCGGDLSRASYECLNPRSGDIDFYDERVHETHYSRLLGLVHTGRAIPVPLVPDEEYLGFQYVMGYGRPSDGYYSGSYDYSSLSRFDGDGTAYRIARDPGVASFEAAPGGWSGVSGEDSGFAHESVVSYPGEGGVALELHRQAEIRYVDD